MRRRAAAIVPLAAAVALLAAGCGQSGSAISLRQWECAQDARDTAELQSALSHTSAFGSGAGLAQQLRSMAVPGLQPVSFVDPTLGTPLPWAALDAPRRDTLLGWLEAAAPSRVRLDRDVYDGAPNELIDLAPGLAKHCAPETFPQEQKLSGSVPWNVALEAVPPISQDAQELASDTATPHEAARAAEAVVDIDVRRGAPSMMQWPVAVLLGRTFAADVLASAASAPARADYDGDADGLLGAAADRAGRSSVRFSARQLVDVILGLRKNRDALHDFLASMASASATVLHAAATDAGQTRKVDGFGAFTGLLDVAAFDAHDDGLAAEARAFDRAVVFDLAGHPKRAKRALADAVPVDASAWFETQSDAFRTFAVGAAYVDSGKLGPPDSVRAYVCPDCTTAFFLDASGRVDGNLRAEGVANVASALAHGVEVEPAALAAAARDAAAWREAGGCCVRSGS